MILFLFTLFFTKAHSTLYYELHDLGWRISQNELRVQVTQTFLRQESEKLAVTISKNEIQHQSQKLQLNYGITDRLELYLEAGRQTKFTSRMDGNLMDDADGSYSPAFGFSYRVVEEYPAFCNIDFAAFFSPKSGEIHLGERTNFLNGGDILSLLLAFNKKFTEKHEWQLSYEYVGHSEKELRFYSTPITFDEATITPHAEHALQATHNYKFRPSVSLLSTIRLEEMESKKISIPSIPSTRKDLSSNALSLATGMRWNIADKHLFSFMIGAKWQTTLITEISTLSDEKTRDRQSEFIMLHYAFTHQLF